LYIMNASYILVPTIIKVCLFQGSQILRAYHPYRNHDNALTVGSYVNKSSAGSNSMSWPRLDDLRVDSKSINEA